MFNKYITAFSQRLSNVNTEVLGVKGYPAAYLQLLLKQRVYFLRIYAQVLQYVVEHSPKPKEEIILLDYGAGNGLLGMFAKYCGFKKVYSIDINKNFVHAAELLNKYLNNPVDVLLTGDWNAVEDFCKNNAVPDAIAGTDVIEHIYDVDAFLKNIKTLNKDVVTVFTTASVTDNPFKTHAIKKLQHGDEYQWSNPEHTSPANPYAGLPFLEVRKRIIQQHFNLPEQQVALLATATRGLRETDILEATNTFINTKQLPHTINHPTNTCDPITGNWTEQLITPASYKLRYRNAGFQLHIYNGFYNEWQSGIKAFFLAIINRYIHASGRFGRWISAYIVLVGK